MSDATKPLLVISTESDDPEHQKEILEWADEFDDTPPWDQYNLMVTGPEESAHTAESLDALADAIAGRITDGPTAREAFIAGFMATGEGYNGEYVSSETPREKAGEEFEEWRADSDTSEGA
jgi:hypothetical protein